MIPTALLPSINALLNSLSAILLVAGYIFIRQKRIAAHQRAMLAACSTSALFLISYIVYHVQAGSRPFAGQGPARILYFTILISHTILATAIVPLVIMTLRRALRQDFVAHRRLARRTLPLWLYVSVTGVIVYWMLYQLY